MMKRDCLGSTHAVLCFICNVQFLDGQTEPNTAYVLSICVHFNNTISLDMQIVNFVKLGL